MFLFMTETMSVDISLVVPVRNEEASMERLLGSISSQTKLPGEVIIVDAGSSDGTKRIIENYRGAEINLKLRSIGDAHPGTARNAGAREARYGFIAFTDGGIELDKNWLRELSETMEGEGPCDVVYGSYIPRTSTFFKQCLAMAVVPPAGNRTSFIASTLLKKTVWQDVGGFPDFRAAEDRIFMNRIKEKGFKVRYNPRAVVIWDIPSDIVKAFGRFYNYSFHDLKAGVARDWHLPVAKMYLSASVLLIMAIVFSPLFFVLLAAGFLARTARKVFMNRGEPYFRKTMMPFYIFLVSVLVLVTDLAMFAGAVRYSIEGLKR